MHRVIMKVIGFILIPFCLLASGQTTHIYYAKQYLKDHPEYNEAQFLRGTIFPDIRYIAGLPRDATHQKGTLDLVSKAPNDFEAGMRFHWFVDSTINSFYNEEISMTFLQSDELKALRAQFSKGLWCHFLKLAHCEFLDPLVEIDPLSLYFDGIPHAPLEKEIQLRHFQEWHRIVHLMLAYKPSLCLHILLKPYKMTIDQVCKIQKALVFIIDHPDFHSLADAMDTAIAKKY